MVQRLSQNAEIRMGNKGLLTSEQAPGHGTERGKGKHSFEMAVCMYVA